MKPNYKMIAVLIGLVLLAKRSPNELADYGTVLLDFITDPENFAGAVLVGLGLRKEK
jgi:hypothetical protein